MHRAARIMAVICLVLLPLKSDAEDVKLDDLTSKFSYMLGVQLGVQITEQVEGAESGLVKEAVAAGIADIFAGVELKLTQEEMNEVTAAYQQQAEEQRMAMNEANMAAGEAFRAEYAQRDNVHKTDSGLLYTVLEEGSGEKPGGDSTVTVHYSGSLINGQKFDSSYDRGEPTSFGLSSIIPGWNEILQLMPTGSKWQVVIPPELAYGAAGAPPAIPPQSTLVFEIELISFE